MDRQTGYRGYGLAIEEAEPGLSAIAVTVCPQGGAPQGMLAITGPAVRMGYERIAELVEIARQGAKELAMLWPLRHIARTDIPRPKALA